MSLDPDRDTGLALITAIFSRSMPIALLVRVALSKSKLMSLRTTGAGGGGGGGGRNILARAKSLDYLDGLVGQFYGVLVLQVI
jgi:hypothetical protein